MSRMDMHEIANIMAQQYLAVTESKIFLRSKNVRKRFNLKVDFNTTYDYYNRIFALIKLNEAGKEIFISPEEREYKDFYDKVLKLQEEICETPGTSEVLTYTAQLLGYDNITELIKNYTKLDNRMVGYSSLKIWGEEFGKEDYWENHFVGDLVMETLTSILNRTKRKVREIKVTKLRRIVVKKLRKINNHEQGSKCG